MNKLMRIIAFIAVTAVLAGAVCACGTEEKTTQAVQDQTTEPADKTSETKESIPEKTTDEKQPDDADPDDYSEGLGETFTGETNAPKEGSDMSSEEDEEPVTPSKDVDLIFFMGQSNMSGAAGDAKLAPYVSEEAGMEFRSVSDPTTLYPITEPFGINENNPSGLHEYPGAKKGSLVSAFVNEYYKETGRRVIAVSVSMGATDTNAWMTQGVIDDVKKRFDTSVSYLKNNGYKIWNIYAVWLHGESDAIDGTDPEVYRTQLDNIMRPLFIGGLQKVFIITPGRTIDYRDIFLKIIDMQKKICYESGYYALATTVLTKVSTEYMSDQYHYNQHVLNMVGIEAAKAAAFYQKHGVEKIVYDYREGKYVVPDGVDEDSQTKDKPIPLGDININEVY